MSSTGDIRLSDPNGTALFESLTFKKKTNENINKVEEQPKAHSLGNNDNRNVNTSSKVPENTNVNFVDKSIPENSVPLRDSNTGKVIKMITDDNGFPILDQNGELQFDEQNGKPVYVKADSQGNPILDEENNFQIVQSANQVSKNSYSEAEDLPSLQEYNKTENKKSNSSIELSLPLVNPETGEVLKFQVDNKGKPVLDQNGEPIKDPKGKPLFIKVTEDGQPILDKNGQPIFMDEQKKQLPQSANKVMLTLYGKTAKTAVTKLSSTLVKGASFTIPFTSKTIGFGVKHAVQKAVTQELAKVAVAKTGSTTIVKALEKTAVDATVGATKTLTNAGKLGKGTETLTRTAFGKWFQPSAYTQVVKESANGLAKTGKIISEGGSKAAGEVIKKTAVGASEKVLQKGVQEGIEGAVKTVIKKGGKEVAEKVATKGTQKALTVTAEKAAVKAASSGTAKTGSKLAGAVPFIGAAINLGITAYDTVDAVKKTKDPNVSKLSAGLAWATVGLDVVSTVTVATGVGAPIGWIASGLSIGTSIASDYFK